MFSNPSPAPASTSGPARPGGDCICFTLGKRHIIWFELTAFLSHRRQETTRVSNSARRRAEGLSAPASPDSPSWLTDAPAKVRGPKRNNFAVRHREMGPARRARRPFFPPTSRPRKSRSAVGMSRHESALFMLSSSSSRGIITLAVRALPTPSQHTAPHTSPFLFSSGRLRLLSAG